MKLEHGRKGSLPKYYIKKRTGQHLLMYDNMLAITNSAS